MVEAIFAGCALGAVYALASGGLVITYVSSGVLNFAYAALAYFVARLYYFLHVQLGWGIAPAAVVAIVIVGPSLGVLLWALLFRFLHLASPLINIVVMIGLSVCLPPIAILLFGNHAIVNPPGLAPQPVRVFHVAGGTVTMDQLIIYGCAIVIFAGGAAVLHWTKAGLLVRAVVDSGAMSSLSGIRPGLVAMAVWAASTFSAGLAGVLMAPIIGLDASSFTVLIAAAFTAVVAARLTNVNIAVFVGLLIGVVTEVVEGYLPTASQFTADVIPSIPFIILLLYLIFSALRGGNLRESQSLGGPLDRAIAPQGGSEAALARAVSVARAGTHRLARRVPMVLAIVVIIVLPLMLRGLWVGMVGLGLAYGTVFLSCTISAGDGGMVWLCQITFAGIGAFTTALLVTDHRWPVVPALVAGGLVCAVIGAIVGFLMVRLGDLYVALVTLTFGVLIENLIFRLPLLYNYGAGVALSPPGFAGTSRAFAWFAAGVFLVLALALANLRRSTFGLAVSAVRWSEPAARTIGLSVVRTKVTLSACAAFVAGVGGALLAMYAQAAIPDSFATFTGLTWLAVLVTVGFRTVSGALIAGLAFSFVPELFTAFLPTSWGEVPPALFGLGAVLVARNPEGTLAMHARQLEELVGRGRAASVADLASGTVPERGRSDGVIQ